MTDERKILTLSLTAAAFTAAVPAVLGVLKSLRPQPLADCDRLHADGAGFADALGNRVALHAIELPLVPAVFLRDGADCPAAETEPALTARFGPYGAKQLLEAARFGAAGSKDLQTFKSLGVNCLQVPLRSDRLCKKANARDEIDFTALDALAARCRAAGVYLLLSLTALPEALLQDSRAGFEARNAVLRQWLQIAAHFREEPAVAGFILLELPAKTAQPELLQKFCARLVKTLRGTDPDRIFFLPPLAQMPDGENLAVFAASRDAAPAERDALDRQLPADLPCLVTVSSTDDPAGALQTFAGRSGLSFAGYFGPRGCLYAAVAGEAPDLVREDYKALTAKCGAVLSPANLRANDALCGILRETFGGAIKAPRPKTTLRFGLHPQSEETE